LIPVYAVDCDDDKNKRLCADQGVQGFPTVKLYPRGKSLAPMVYDSGERTASGFYYWASRRVPNSVQKLYRVEDIPSWVNKHVNKPRALLLTKDKKVPLLWQVLGNKYQGELELANHRDRKGKSSVILGYEAGEKKEAKVLIYPVGSTKPVRYQGINKLESLSKFFDSVLDGTADLEVVNEEAAAEEFVLDETELEIERKQEAQRIALAHGGFAELIDFEKAVKEGGAADYHDSHGYPGMMGAPPASRIKKATAGEATATAGGATATATNEPPASNIKVTAGEATATATVTSEPPAKKSVAPPAGQCESLGDVPGEHPVECTPPGVDEPSSERPKDEL